MGGFNEDDAQATIQQWLLEGVEFDAVFAGDDDTATGVLSALHRAGKRIPLEVKVAGFDDLPVARFLTPPLTTVRAPIEQVGREAVRQLVRLIRGQAAEARTMMPTELVIRESCGCTTELA